MKTKHYTTLNKETFDTILCPVPSQSVSLCYKNTTPLLSSCCLVRCRALFDVSIPSICSHLSISSANFPSFEPFYIHISQKHHIQQHITMRSADFPTVRFGAGPGPRSDSCDICMLRISSRERSAVHEGCQNAFHRECFKGWAESQTRQQHTTTCPMCRAPLNQPTFHRPQLTDYELEHDIPRIEVQRSRPSDRRSQVHSPQPYDPSRERYERVHETRRDYRDYVDHGSSHYYGSSGIHALEHRSQVSRDGSQHYGSHRARPSDYSADERTDYAYHGRESSHGGRDIPRSRGGDRYERTSGAEGGRRRLWEDIYELEG